jgi:hypothetical protein
MTTTHTPTTNAEELQRTIKEIGLARFVGRIQSGFVAEEEGYNAVDAYVDNARKRPLLSQIVHAILNRQDVYSK